MSEKIYNDVFISYARKNRDFAKKLVAAIETRNEHEVWVDWEDIDFSEDWWSKIQAGIEAADAFVFILSPHSARSKVCYDEVDHAVRNGKRIIPVLHEEISDKADLERLHPAIKLHNWLPFDDEDNFEDVFKKLVETIETDFAHVRSHTRFLLRAKEWQVNQRQSARLLMGIEVQEAVKWLESAEKTGKKPRPIDLHQDYIRSSQRAQKRRQQQLGVGLSFAATVTILAILSFLLFQDAQSNLGLANLRGTEVAQQASTSDSNARIAADNAATATIAQGEAIQQADTADSNARIAANNAATATIAQGEAIQQAGTAEAYRSTAESDALYNGETAVAALGTSEQRGTAVVNQASTAEANATIAYQNASTAQAAEVEAVDARATSDSNLRDAWIVQSRFYSDLARQRFEAGDIHTALLLSLQALEHFDLGIYETETTDLLLSILQNPVQEIAAFQMDNPADAAYFYNDSAVYAYDVNGNSYLWDIETGEELFQISLGVDIQSSYFWDYERQEVLTTDAAGNLILWDVANQIPLMRLQHESAITYAIREAEGTRFVTGTAQGIVRVWDMANGELLLNLQHGASINRIVLLQEENLVLAVGNDGILRAWNMDTGELRYLLNSDAAWPNTILVNQDQSLLITYPQFSAAGATASIRMWEADTGELVQVFSVQGNTEIVSWSHDEERISVHADENTTGCHPNCRSTIFVFDADTGEKLLEIPQAKEVGGTLWSEDDRQLMSYGLDGLIHIWDSETGAELRVLELGGSILTVNWNQELGEVAAWSPEINTARVWNVETGQILATVYHENFQYAQWDGARKRLLTRDTLGTIRVWSYDNASILTSVPYGDTGIGVRLSASGERAILRFGNEFQIWDTRSGETLLEFSGLTSLRWSSDESLLMATRGEGEGVLIFDATTGEQIQAIPDPEAIAFTIWGNDNQEVLLISPQGAMRRWNVATGLPLERTSLNDEELELNFRANWDAGYFAAYEREGNTIYVWDNTGELLTEIPFEGVFYIHWEESRNILTAMSGTSSRKLLIYNVDQRRVIFERDYDFFINGSPIRFDETQAVVPVAEDVYAVIDFLTGQERFQFEESSLNNAHWSPDGRYFATMSGDLGGVAHIWDATTGELVWTLATPELAHVGSAVELEWDETGSRVLIVNADDTLQDSLGGLVRVWDIQTGQLIVSYRHNGDPFFGTWLPAWDSVMVWGIDADGALSIYPASLEQIIHLAQERKVREFSNAENALYYQATVTAQPSSTPIPLEVLPSPTAFPAVPPLSFGERILAMNLDFSVFMPVIPLEFEGYVIRSYSLINPNHYFTNPTARMRLAPADIALRLEIGREGDSSALLIYEQDSPYRDLEDWLEDNDLNADIEEISNTETVFVRFEGGAELYAFIIDDTFITAASLEGFDDDAFDAIVEETIAAHE